MSKEILHLPHTQPHSPSLEIIAPLSTRMLFSRARYLNSSAFLCHVPFLFWLIEACRPKIFVELGVGKGVSYFAACQAIDKLDLDARCHGIASRDTEANIPESVSKYNTQHYGDFSRLHTEDMREVVHQFADGSIDLLHVDIDPSEESILDCLSHDWARKLSPQGVVLLHGVTSRFSGGRAQNFLDRLVASYPSITLEGGEGLTAVLYGEDRHERLVKLADLTFGMAGYSEVHHVFGRLGSTHSFEWSARIEAERAAKVREKYEASENALQKSEEQRETLQKRVGALDSTYDARTEQIAVLQGKLFDLQVAQEEKEAETGVLRRRLDETQAEAIATRDATLADSQRAVKDQASELDKLKAQMTTRFDEIAALTKTLDTKEKEQAAALAAAERAQQEKDSVIAKLTVEHDADRAELGSLRAAFEKVQAEQAEAIAMRDTALANSQRAVEDLKAQMATRFNEIAALTRMLQTAEEELATALAKAQQMRESETEALNGALAAREDDMRRLQQELDDVRIHRDDLLNSTSWKLTQPVRKAVDAMRR